MNVYLEKFLQKDIYSTQADMLGYEWCMAGINLVEEVLMVQSLPWYVAVFQSVPETFLVLLLGFAIFNYEIRAKDALIISVLNAICSYLIHHLPIIFGMHTILLLISCTFLTVCIAKKDLFKVSFSIIGGVTCSVLLQGLLVPIVFAFTHLNLQTLQQHPGFYIIVFLPTGIIMTLLYFLIRKTDFYILNFGLRTDEIEEI